ARRHRHRHRTAGPLPGAALEVQAAHPGRAGRRPTEERDRQVRQTRPAVSYNEPTGTGRGVRKTSRTAVAAATSPSTTRSPAARESARGTTPRATPAMRAMLVDTVARGFLGGTAVTSKSPSARVIPT